MRCVRVWARIVDGLRNRRPDVWKEDARARVEAGVRVRV